MTDEIPDLDCHAHISADVTDAQLRALGETYVFAVTRSLEEAALVKRRRDPLITWGIGVHPGVPSARSEFDLIKFEKLLPDFALVGEIGLDGSRGDIAAQRNIFNSILTACSDVPVLLSVHSSGATSSVVDIMSRHQLRGSILHWFLGSREEVDAAVELGAYFSVNGAMSDASISILPRDRILPETDFPARRTRAKKPGETAFLVKRLSALWDVPENQVRYRFWVNLRTLSVQASVLDRISESLADVILEY